MKTKDYIFILIIIGLVITLYLMFDTNNSFQEKLNEKDLQIKYNLYQIDSLHYEYDKLEMKQDTLRLLIKQDSILIEKKQAGINKLYHLLKENNEKIDNSSGTDDYEYLLNISE